MADITVNPRDKNSLSITNRDKTGASVTWDEIRGTWVEHATDTWDSPRMGTNKNTKNDLTITNISKN